jgi:hypothetical protein
MYKEISSKWKVFNIEQVNKEMNNFGVYEIADKNKLILNIGEGKVKSRLLAKHPSKRNNLEKILNGKYYRCEYTKSKLRCEQRERALQIRYKNGHNGKLPYYNNQLGDI